MATWTNDELRKIAAAEELELASVRRDGTLGHAVTTTMKLVPRSTAAESDVA